MTGVCSITINGKSYQLRFGMPACRMFLEKISNDDAQVISGDTVNETGIAYLVYSGYYNECIASEKPLELKFADILEYVEMAIDDPIAQKEFEEMAKCYRDSKQVSKFIQKLDEQTDEIKKKTTELNGI